MQVNPMSEIRAIAEACRRECLPASARLLWRVLFDCANDRQKFNAATNAYDWPDDFFPIDNAELILNSALEKRALLEARNRLKQIGAIDFKPGENNRRPARYRINYLTACRYKNVPAEVPAEVPAQVPAGAPAHVPIYIKDKDTGIEKDVPRDDDDDDVEDIIRAGAREDGGPEADPVPDRGERSRVISSGFAAAFGRKPYPNELERLVTGSWRLGLGPEMTLMALNVAAGAGASSPVYYAMAILSEWRNHEVRTPEQAEEYQVEYLQENRKYGLGGGDPVEEYRRRRDAQEKRRQENEKAGLVRYG